MSKQRPDPNKIANELRGASSFFKRPDAPAPQEPTPSAEIVPVTPSAPPAPAQNVPAPVRPGRPASPQRRQMIRHPFELYMDQLDRLREVAQEQRQRGESGSMSKMVRDAIDRYLDEQPPSN
ncbi:MAG: hypothetical protein M3Q71_08905 [Chloroflexota bacterium]|nr:hypothetical protein [Chloroflexota bacterium]MDP9470775.1 hypothetical protein [Chloroflexota bacterium]